MENYNDIKWPAHKAQRFLLVLSSLLQEGTQREETIFPSTYLRARHFNELRLALQSFLFSNSSAHVYKEQKN